MRRIAFATLGLFAVVLGLLLAGLFSAGSASAHATIVATDPVDGSRLAAVPTSATVTFDESVGLGSIGYLHVIDQLGRRVDTGAASHPGGDGSKVSVAIRPGLGDGTYTGSYRVISADSHPIAGAFRFVVGNGTLAAGSVVTGSNFNNVTGAALDVVRGIEFGGLALLGGGWLLLTVWPSGCDDRRARALLWTGWGASVGGAVAELLLQGPYDAGDGLGAITRFNLLDATLRSDFGLAHSLRLIALGILAAVLGVVLRSLERGRAGLEELAGLLVVGIAVTFAASGHASSEHPKWLAMTSDTLHLLAMSAWVGGLAFLLIAVLPRREPAELQRVLPAFSMVAYVSVATLAITGTYQAWLGVGSWRALGDTTYGRLVLLKIVLFLTLLTVGNLSRVQVQRRWSSPRPVAYAMSDDVVDRPAGRPSPAPESPAPSPVVPSSVVPSSVVPSSAVPSSEVPEPTPVAKLMRAVFAEALVAVGVLSATAVLVAAPPGAAALAIADSKPHTATVKLAAGRTAAITVSTQRHGPVSFTVTLNDGTAPQQVTATAALPAKELGPVAIPLTSQSANHYAASSVLLPAAGVWTITLTVRTSEFDSTVAVAYIALH